MDDGDDGDDDDDEEDMDEDEDDDDDEDDDEECHPLCKKPEECPLQEPRFGLAFWSDPIPREVNSHQPLPSPSAKINTCPQP